MPQSIYQVIKNHVGEDGLLPADFSLAGLQYASDPYVRDGARDAALFFHERRRRIASDEFTEVFSLFAEGDFTEAFALLQALLERHSLVRSLDIVVEGLRGISNNGDPYAFINQLIQLLTETSDAELLKFALLGLENVALERLPSVKETILTLALCNEFTFFASLVASHWPDGDVQLHRMAAKVRGWGRTLLVPRLNLHDKDVNLWLLEEGRKNEASPEYTATVILSRSLLPSVLQDPELDEEHFQDYSELFLSSIKAEPMLNTFEDLNPVQQIELSELWISRVDQFSLNATSCEILLRLGEYFQFLQMMMDNEEAASDFDDSNSSAKDLPDLEPYLEYREEITKLAIMLEGMIDVHLCLSIIQNERGEAAVLELQDIMGMLPRPQDIIEQIKEDPQENFAAIAVLMDHPDGYKPVLRFFIKSLPLNDMAQGPGGKRESSRLTAEEELLIELLRCMRLTPWQGRELLLTGLQSSHPSCRLSALMTLQIWMVYAGKPLRAQDGDLQYLLSTLHRFEDKPLLRYYLYDISHMYVRKK